MNATSNRFYRTNPRYYARGERVPSTDRILLARALPQDDSNSPFWLPSENHFNSLSAATRRESPASTKRNKQAQEKYQYGQHQ